jgi:CheY-like chemotaxis protein
MASGHAALDLLVANEAEGFDLLISDYAMPGFTGAELAAAVRKRWPNLPVLLITGYNEIAGEAHAGQGWDWLQKPFRRADLAEHVRRLIAVKRPDATYVA